MLFDISLVQHIPQQSFQNILQHILKYICHTIDVQPYPDPMDQLVPPNKIPNDLSRFPSDPFIRSLESFLTRTPPSSNDAFVTKLAELTLTSDLASSLLAFKDIKHQTSNI